MMTKEKRLLALLARGLSDGEIAAASAALRILTANLARHLEAGEGRDDHDNR
jgi:hypothetical protein